MTITRQSIIFSVMLAFLLIIYTAGLLNLLIILVGGQELNPEIWRPDALSAYTIVFALGIVSALATWGWKKLGLQGLFMTVLFSGILFGLFGPPFPTLGLTFPIILVGVTIVLLVFVSFNRKLFFTIF